MKDNIIIKQDSSKLMPKKAKVKVIEAKILELLIEQMEAAKEKRDFEKTPSLLGMSNSQFLAIQEFIKFYKVH